MLWQPEQWIWLHKGHKALLWQQSSHLYKHFLPCLCLCIMGCSHIFLSHLYGMFNIWQKLSAFPIISSISFQLSSSWGEQITNCSTLEKESKSITGSTVLTKLKGVFMAQSAEIKRGFTAPTTTDLFKLMHPEDAPSVPTMTAHLEAN